jgi:hypothetical protein
MRLENAIAPHFLKNVLPGARVLNFGGFAGVWKNELGSTMTLAVQNGQVTGTYSSTVSGGGGGTVDGRITGFADEDIISIVVKWDGSSSMTAWVGQVVDIGGTDTIKTLWHLIRNVDDASEPTRAWSAVLAGADQFTR